MKANSLSTMQLFPFYVMMSKHKMLVQPHKQYCSHKNRVACFYICKNKPTKLKILKPLKTFVCTSFSPFIQLLKHSQLPVSQQNKHSVHCSRVF